VEAHISEAPEVGLQVLTARLCLSSSKKVEPLVKKRQGWEHLAGFALKACIAKSRLV